MKNPPNLPELFRSKEPHFRYLERLRADVLGLDEFINRHGRVGNIALYGVENKDLSVDMILRSRSVSYQTSQAYVVGKEMSLLWRDANKCFGFIANYIEDIPAVGKLNFSSEVIKIQPDLRVYRRHTSIDDIPNDYDSGEFGPFISFDSIDTVRVDNSDKKMLIHSTGSGVPLYNMVDAQLELMQQFVEPMLEFTVDTRLNDIIYPKDSR